MGEITGSVGKALIALYNTEPMPFSGRVFLPSVENKSTEFNFSLSERSVEKLRRALYRSK